MKKQLIMFAAVLMVLLSNTALAKKSLLDEDGVDLLKADKVYTAVNLHPDNERGKLSTINYQLPALLPRCTEIEIRKYSKKKMVFRVVSSGREYVFAQHKRTKYIPLSEQLPSFFTSSCSDAEVSALGSKDQEGIKVGRPLVGMTKEGVLLAMGRPPVHVNPELSALEWTYWKNKFVRTIITFNEQGVVTGIR